MTTTALASGEKIDATLTKDSKSVNVEGLSAGIPYIFTIVPRLKLADATIVDGVPEIVIFNGSNDGTITLTNVVFTDISHELLGEGDKVTLNWSVDTFQEGVDKVDYLETIIKTFRIEISKNGGNYEVLPINTGTAERLDAALSKASRSATISGLLKDIKYKFKITIIGSNDTDIGVVKTKNIVSSDAEIKNLSGRIENSNSVELAWRLIEALGKGHGVKSFSIEMKKGNAAYSALTTSSNPEKLNSVLVNTASNISITGLTENVEYQFRLKVELTDGTMSIIEPASFRGQNSVIILAPEFRNLSITEDVQAKTATLNWVLANSDGVNRIIIEMKKGNADYVTLPESGVNERLETSIRVESSSVKVINLKTNEDVTQTNNIIYSFRIKALSSDGTLFDSGDFVKSDGTTTEIFIPRSPSIGEGSVEANNERTELTLKWKEVQGTVGSSAISSYEIGVNINNAQANGQKVYTVLSTSGTGPKLTANVQRANSNGQVIVTNVNNVTNDYEFKIVAKDNNQNTLSTLYLEPDPSLKIILGDTVESPEFAAGTGTFTKQIIVDKLNEIDPDTPLKYTLSNFHEYVKILKIPEGYTTIEVLGINNSVLE